MIRPIIVLVDLSEVNFCITYPIQKKWRATVKINCMPIYGKCIDSLSIWILSIWEKSGYLSLRQISQLKDYFWRNWADSTSLLSICFSIHDSWCVKCGQPLWNYQGVSYSQNLCGNHKFLNLANSRTSQFMFPKYLIDYQNAEVEIKI